MQPPAVGLEDAVAGERDAGDYAGAVQEQLACIDKDAALAARHSAGAPAPRRRGSGCHVNLGCRV